jgi:hypothetical protein
MCEAPYTRADLEKLIKELLGITEIPFQIKRQIRDFSERGFSNKGIARALCYACDVKHMKLHETYQQYGIGIVRNIYAEANNYFEKLRAEKLAQEQRQQEMLASSEELVVVIPCTVTDRKKPTRRKHIDLSEL